MNKKWKRIISVLLAVCASISLCLSSYASTGKNEPNKNGSQYTTYSLQDMRAIAMNALLSDFIMKADNGTWDGVEVVKETPLYDTEGNLTSYCFDLKCDQQNSYIVISATSKNYPVMQFASHASSQYLEIDDSQNGIYVGPGQYYIQNSEDNSVVNLVSGETVKIKDTGVAASYCNEIVEDFGDVAHLYITGEILNQPKPIATETESQVLYSVPCYQRYKGCAPTAMAMILDYHYSGFTSMALMSELAKNMGTKSDGSTEGTSVPSGAIKTLKAHGKSYTSIRYASTENTLFGTIINSGASYNTFDDYKSEILANRPVFVVMKDAKYTTDSFPDGFGEHAVAGIGFDCASQTNYIVMYTTSQRDGHVYVPLNPTSMGKYAWCFVVP